MHCCGAPALWKCIKSTREIECSSEFPHIPTYRSILPSDFLGVMLPTCLLQILALSLSVSATVVPRASPVAISLTARKASRGRTFHKRSPDHFGSGPSSGKKKNLSPANVPLKDFFNGTDLQYVLVAFMVRARLMIVVDGLGH